MPVEDHPERKAGKKRGERRAGEGFQDQRESWADRPMSGLERKGEI